MAEAHVAQVQMEAAALDEVDRAVFFRAMPLGMEAMTSNWHYEHPVG